MERSEKGSLPCRPQGAAAPVDPACGNEAIQCTEKGSRESLFSLVLSSSRYVRLPANVTAAYTHRHKQAWFSLNLPVDSYTWTGPRQQNASTSTEKVHASASSQRDPRNPSINQSCASLSSWIFECVRVCMFTLDINQRTHTHPRGVKSRPRPWAT